ncbi:ADP-ribosylglycohydrolase family protein [Roseovarius sp.]|uniref:ADP-ribosylglycohydrolase family protein n=1 Tax=Roseovarius sp. TaxID=1486281 RepID=UPI0026050A78|nr:ADP-ribosylglycohydrolase family protein [Roseovarius sp.]MDM8165239.1 ADP-ribosylglycohydrolase family protein [Roseovarius sp.]
MTQTGKPFSQDQARGMLIGLAVGDALGTTLEFRERGTFEPVTTVTGGGPFKLDPGQWTDDTSMAMCLAQMLRSANGWDPEDAMKRFVNWRRHGYLSSTGVCFDIGVQTAEALDLFEKTRHPYCGPTDEAKSGNGGIMRLAPVVLAYGAQVDSAMAVAQMQSRLTHASPTCMKAAASMARFMVTGDTSLLPRPDAPPDVASGYVVHTLHAAFWALTQGDTFRDVLLAAVNLGGDADTVGAVAGQLAGRIYGYEGIPAGWRAVLHDHDKILTAADDLYVLRPIDV